MLKIRVESPVGQTIAEVFNAISWRQNTKLSRVGSFECQIPFLSSTALTPLCRLFAFWKGKEIGSGIIENIEKDTDSRIVTLSGLDLLHELSYIPIYGAMYIDEEVVPLVGHEQVFDREQNEWSVWHWWWGDQPGEGPLNDVDTYLYLGTLKKCNAIIINLAELPTESGTNIGFGYSKSEGWTEYKLKNDGTNGLSKNGMIQLIGRPTNHVMNTLEGHTFFWVRIDPKKTINMGDNDESLPVKFSSITSVVRLPVLNDLEVLFEHSNKYGRIWNVSQQGTELGSLTFYEYKSLLNIIVALAMQRGEQWRLGTGRNIEWLGKMVLEESYEFIALGDSGRTFSIDSLEDNEFIIKHLSEGSNFEGFATRIYPASGNNATLTIDLREATLPMPLDYEINTIENYIRNINMENNFGVMATSKVFRSVVGIDGAGGDEFTSNILAEMCLNELQCEVKRSVRIVALGKAVPKVGSIIKIDFFHQDMEIKSNFFLVELETRIDKNGVVYTMECSNIPKIPETDEEFEIRKIIESEDARSFPNTVYGSYVLDAEHRLPRLSSPL